MMIYSGAFLLSLLGSGCAFAPSRFASSSLQRPATFLTKPLYMSEGDEPAEKESKLSEEELETVGNLVADEEWMGLTAELGELVRVAVLEELETVGNLVADEEWM